MPLLFIFSAPLAAALVISFVKNKVKIFEYLTIVASLAEAVAAFMVASVVLRAGTYASIPYFSIDALGAIMMVIVAITGLIASWYSASYLRQEVAKGIIGFGRVKQYYLLLNLFVLAMFVAIATTSPVVMWIAIEATTLSTAFLISFYGKPSSVEAAWKYLIVNSVGLLLGFFGTLLFLSYFNNSDHGLVDWHVLAANAAYFNPALIKIAFIFVFVGYGTKMGLVPMHTWRPDAYARAPTPLVALLSGALLNVAFLAVLRFKVVADIAVGQTFSQNIFIGFGLASIVLAAFIILVQKNYKRLLGYSSIEHAGIMTLGFGFGGLGVYAAILHMIYHSLVKTILFLSAGNIFLKFSSTKIVNVRGVLTALPVTGVIFFVGVLAVTGMPPFGIFLTEISILSAGIVHHPAVAITALLALALVFVGFLRHTAGMVFGDSPTAVGAGETRGTVLPLIILLAVLAILSVYIPPSVNSLIHSATSIFN